MAKKKGRTPEAPIINLAIYRVDRDTQVELSRFENVFSVAFIFSPQKYWLAWLGEETDPHNRIQASTIKSAEFSSREMAIIFMNALTMSWLTEKGYEVGMANNLGADTFRRVLFERDAPLTRPQFKIPGKEIDREQRLLYEQKAARVQQASIRVPLEEIIR